MSNNKMLIDAAHPEETRVVMVRGNRVDEFDFESEHKTQLRGNIYLAKVTRVEPSLQAAFVDYGGNRHGFLAFSEIHPDYYQIPVADRQALLDAEAEDARAAAAAEADDDNDEIDASEEAVEKPPRKRRSRRRGKKTEAKDSVEAEGAEAETGDDAAQEEQPAESDDADANVAASGDESATDDTPKADAEAAESEEDDGDENTISADNENDDVVSEPAAQAAEDGTEAPVKKPRKRAVRKKKPVAKAEDAAVTAETAEDASSDSAAQNADQSVEDETAGETATAAKPARRTARKTSRPKKNATKEESDVDASSDASETAETTESSAAEEQTAEDKPKRKRRRTSRKKASDEDSGETTEETSAVDAVASDDQVADASTDSTETAADAAKEEAPRRSRSRSRRRGGKSDNRDQRSTNDSDTENGAAVEDLGSEDALAEVPARRAPRRHYKIQEVIKRRQILLVQVVKEERGNKGAALTTYLSLAGRYSVLMPNTARGGGISRKITNAADRKRLKAIASELEVPQGMGVILRTAGASRQQEDVQPDFECLMRLWENVRTLTLESTATFLVYEEGSLIKRSIRDLYDKDTGEIQVAGEAGYREAKDFMTMLMPNHAKNVKLYRDRIPMFARMGVESQLDAMLQPQVTLKSGGYIIIDQTEALVAIDVNSGRSTRQHSIEETATQTNLEAADEVARQLRLRDLAGLIVIDFIDMEDKRNIKNVEKRLKDALKNDRARIQVGRISHFGLMEMSRQRIRASVLESTTQVCPTCEGLGHVRAASSVVLSVLRTIEEYLNRNSRNNITVNVSTPTALYMLNNKRDNLGDLETRFGVAISIVADDGLGSVACTIERGEASRRQPVAESAVQPDSIDLDADVPAPEAESQSSSDNAVADSDEESNGEPRKRRRRRRRRKGGGDAAAEGGTEEDATAENAAAAEVADNADATAEAEDAPKPAKRTRRTRAKKSDADQENADPVATDVSAASDATESADGEEKPEEKPKRTRRRKTKATVESETETAPEQTDAPALTTSVEPAEQVDSEERPKRRTTRRKKVEEPAENESTESVMAETAESESVSEVASPTQSAEEEPKKGGWWQRKFF